MIKQVPSRLMHFATAAVKDLKHCALVPEVGHALAAWVRSTVPSGTSGVLIGGLALSFYCRPRATTDVDILFLSDAAIPDIVSGFKRPRPKAFQERDTHVEVEACTPTRFNIPGNVVRKVFDTAQSYEGLRVASLEGMIALKLWGSESPRRELKDLADVVALCESAGPTLSAMTDWHLTPQQRQKLADCKRRAAL